VSWQERHNPTLALFMANRAALVEYASGIIGNRAQAEDLVQEAWLRFDEVVERRFLDQPLAYLYRIVRNLALDGRRRLRRESQVIAGAELDAVAEVTADGRPSAEAVLLYKDEYDLVMEAIAELPERTRIAVEMHRFGGRKLREIAAALGISVPMAHVLVAEGLQRCKRRLGWP
jgi:RNA polymerase sigma factor (sigma-70 family)